MTFDITDAEIHLIAEYDHIPVRGNAIVSGDDDFDKSVEDELIERLNDGDVWAWASVEVYASVEIGGVTVQGDSEYLGCCSYRDESDFVNNSGYYDDMKATALESLIEKVNSLKLALA